MSHHHPLWRLGAVVAIALVGWNATGPVEGGSVRGASEAATVFASGDAVADDVSLSYRCAGYRAIVEASVTNRGEQAANYALRANALAPRRSVLQPDASDVLAVRGVGDGAWAVRVNRDGITVASEDFTIDCDPTNDHTGVFVSCMAASGRVDVYVRNEALSLRDVNVTVSSGGQDFVRPLAVPGGSVQRTTVTGLRDGSVRVAIEPSASASQLRQGTSDQPGSGDLMVFRAAIGCARGSDDPVPVDAIDPSQTTELRHEVTSFTQGLTFTTDGRLFESSGAYQGETKVREINPQTGAVVREMGFGFDFFGEGLAAVDDRLWLLSWREGVVRVLDQDTLAVVESHTYDGQGWGLCYDGATLVRSDGTSKLYRHRLEDFAVLETIEVTRASEPVNRLNELDCDDGFVWANVWYSDEVLRIDPNSGAVVQVLDVGALEHPRPTDPNAVANGIARNPVSGDFWLTGKLWTTYSVFQLPSR